MIRSVISDDLPWMLILAKQRFNDIDESDTFNSLSNIIASKNCLIIRGNKAVVASHVYGWMCNHKIRYSEELFLASEGDSGWEIYQLLKKSIEWAKRQNARWYEFGVGDSSKTGKSLEPLAKRLGGLISRPNHYKVVF